MSTDGLELDGGVAVLAGWSGSVLPVESQDSMSAADEAGKAQPDRGSARYEVCSEAISGWTRRIRIGKAPDESREMHPDRKASLELFARANAEKRNGHVVNPTIGTSFDSLDEGYEFYNLYSWECGFGICLGLVKCRLNVQRKRCMQEIVCACVVCTFKRRSLCWSLMSTVETKLESFGDWRPDIICISNCLLLLLLTTLACFGLQCCHRQSISCNRRQSGGAPEFKSEKTVAAD